MGFWNRILGTNKYSSIKESGVGLVSESKNTQTQDLADASRPKILGMYENAYLNFPLVHAIIEAKVNQVVQDFWFVGPNSSRFTKEKDRLNLVKFMQSLTRSLFIYGDAYVETVKKGNKVENLKIVDTKTMQTYRDPSGSVIGYAQTIDNKPMVLWGTTGSAQNDKKFSKKLSASQMSFISHFKLNPLGDARYGVSMIRCLLPMLEIKEQIEHDLKAITRRYIAPLIVAKVGNDDMPATSADITAVNNALEDIHAESELAVSHLVELSTLQFNGKGIDLETPFKHVDEQIISGGNVPGVLVGRSGGTDRAVAEVELRNFGRHVKNIQRQIKADFEDLILRKQLGGNESDFLEWGFTDEREEDVSITQLQGLVGQGILTPQKANSLLPPKFHEKLPENTLNEPRESQADPTSLKKIDNPTDPTKSTKLKDGRRMTRTDVEAGPSVSGKSVAKASA